MTLPDTIVVPLAASLAARGYQTLTAVQSAVLTDEAAGRDLLVSAQTGSGKTVAFGMAIAPTLLAGAGRLDAAGLPLALVIAPTRELAIQVQRELDWLYKDAGALVASCVGGMDMRTERRALERGAHIVVGTPGRLRDHLTRGSLDISALRAAVLDEADEMLDLGFREDLEFILAAAPETRRTLMFSATVPKPIAQLATTFQRDALRITAAGESQQHGDIDYKLITVPAAERENAIINTLLYFDSANTLVFCATRDGVKHLSSRLLNRGFAVVSLSGELSQAERTNALQAMRDGRARVCVATDVAARGIDLPNLDLVIHADLPTNPDTLLHRSGRTGRAGRKGTCVLIVPQHRRGAVARILKLAKVDASSMPAPGMADIDARYRQSILTDPALVAEPSEEEAAFVAELLALHSPERIAAAYLRQQLAKRPAPEDLSDVVSASPPSAIAPRATAERFETGVWFKVSVGRKHQAEPRWLLPMICKAGGVTKSAVGSIRVYDTETRFEISAAEAARFEAAMRDNGSGERGVTISLAEGGDAPAPPGPSRLPPRSEAAPKTRRYEPSLDAEPPRIDPPSSQRPPPHVLNPKDKGKPKYRAKAGYQPQPGDASRPGGAKAKKRKDHKPPRPPQI